MFFDITIKHEIAFFGHIFILLNSFEVNKKLKISFKEINRQFSFVNVFVENIF